MRNLPFYVDNLNGGFMKLEGILRMEEENLIIEYQKKDNVLEAYQSDLKTAKIALRELDICEFKKGWINSRIILHGKNAHSFNDFPGSELTSRELKVKRKNRDLAARFSSRINLKLSEHKLNDMDGDS